mgnify:CR=1 FL=1
MIFSANMLKTYKTCPQKYKLKYVESFSLPQKYEIFEKGKKIHALAYYYLKGDDISRFQSALNEEELKLWEQLRKNEFFNKKTYRAEFELNCKIDRFWVGGRLDAVVYEGRNFYILDYKTGSAPKNPEEDLQTLVYLEALAKHLKGDFDELKFVYIDLKNNRNCIVDYRLINPEIIENICRQIESEKFQPNKENCINCEYKNYCLI